MVYPICWRAFHLTKLRAKSETPIVLVLLPEPAEDMANRTGVRTEYAPHAWDDNHPLQSRHRSLLYRAAREFTLNAAKHASPSIITLTLTRSEKEVAVSVSDNGTGVFGDPSPASGFGLFSIQQQAEAMGGRLEVEAQAGVGSTVKVVLPLVNSAG